MYSHDIDDSDDDEGLFDSETEEGGACGASAHTGFRNTMPWCMSGGQMR